MTLDHETVFGALSAVMFIASLALAYPGHKGD